MYLLIIVKLLKFSRNFVFFGFIMHLNSMKTERKEDTMEKNLCRLFELQRFENNPRLKNMLDDALNRYGFSENEGELSDDDAELLCAAGSQVSDIDKEKLS
jgi:hypothetical protein